jgi:hypothetical protein
MPISRYAKVLLQSPGAGSVVLCFVGLSLGTGLLLQWGRVGHSGPHVAHAAKQAPQEASTEATAPVAPQAVVAARMPKRQIAAVAVTESTVPTKKNSSDTQLVQASYRQPIAGSQLEFLKNYAGQTTHDAIRDRKLREVMDTMIPYTPFHFGLDMPLPKIIESVLLRSQMPVEVRDGRYVMVSTEPGGSNSQAFLWIDIQDGIAFGGLFFHPSNGEPTPTLTLFSRQIKQGSITVNQFPAAFAYDFGKWADTTRVPTVSTRYFINAAGEKFVLAHDEDICKAAPGSRSRSEEACQRMNAEAAGIDQQAAAFLGRTHYASNATMRMTTADAAETAAP